jgi:predicted nucleic acid-binding protein
VRIADTSFLYALFSSTDEFHRRAVGAAEDPQPITIPPEILSETISLIHYRQGHATALAAGEWIRSQGRIEVGVGSRDLSERAWSIYRRGRGRLSYPDSVVLAWSRGRDVRPLAFDEVIVRYGRR